MDDATPILVLVVDDEALISALVAQTLKDGGFQIIEASSWRDAAAILDNRHGEFRAIVTDVNLGYGAQNGWNLAHYARELNPDIPVVYMTGGNAHEWAANGVPNSVLIGKPFAPAQILIAVTQLLNKTG